MRLKVEKGKLKELASGRHINTIQQLFDECGLSYCVLREFYRTGTLSKESLWLVSERLGVSINDFVYLEQ